MTRKRKKSSRIFYLALASPPAFINPKKFGGFLKKSMETSKEHNSSNVTKFSCENDRGFLYSKIATSYLVTRTMSKWIIDNHLEI